MTSHLIHDIGEKTQMKVKVRIVSVGGLQLVSDPWDEDLIASLLSNLQPPLSSHPNLTVWTFRLPSITPKMTVQIGNRPIPPRLNALRFLADANINVRVFRFSWTVPAGGFCSGSGSFRYSLSRHKPHELTETHPEGEN